MDCAEFQAALLAEMKLINQNLQSLNSRLTGAPVDGNGEGDDQEPINISSLYDVLIAIKRLIGG